MQVEGALHPLRNRPLLIPVRVPNLFLRHSLRLTDPMPGRGPNPAQDHVESMSMRRRFSSNTDYITKTRSWNSGGSGLRSSKRCWAVKKYELNPRPVALFQRTCSSSGSTQTIQAGSNVWAGVGCKGYFNKSSNNDDMGDVFRGLGERIEALWLA